MNALVIIACHRIPGKPRFARCCSRMAGFTLVEVLISTVVLAMVVVLLSHVLTNVSGIWQRGQAQVERCEGGRAILDYMAKELQAAQVPVDRSGNAYLQFVVNPSGLSSGDKPCDQIFWQAPLATDQTLGDLAEIGYFVKWTADRQNPRAQLCRFFVNPTTADGNANPNFKIYQSPAAWLSKSILDAVCPADSQDKDNPYEGLFVENVVALWISCIDPIGNVITTSSNGESFSGHSFDSRRGYKYKDAKGKWQSSVLPAAIDVSFVLVDNVSANRITGGLRDAIVGLAAETQSASEFVATSSKDSRFASIRPGLRSCMTRVYLHNSK
ncbi:MAG: prepilin-type N-terminal cleavage/methylation domain-containing protein [Chthoniobacteraceae bacterium]